MRTFYCLLLLVLLASCVPQKNIIYLQGAPTENLTPTRITNTPYRLQIDDILNIKITSTNEDMLKIFNSSMSVQDPSQLQNQGQNYLTGYSIDNKGNIRMPLIGELNVLGLTEKEASILVEEQIRKFIKKSIDVFVDVRLAGIKYTILGEINTPGVNFIFQNRASVLEAIANSGDILPTGNRKNVEIIRITDFGTEKHVLDLTDIDVVNSENFYIRPNDYIHVLPLKQKVLGLGTTVLQNLSTLISVLTLVVTTVVLSRNL